MPAPRGYNHRVKVELIFFLFSFQDNTFRAANICRNYLSSDCETYLGDMTFVE